MQSRSNKHRYYNNTSLRCCVCVCVRLHKRTSKESASNGRRTIITRGTVQTMAEAARDYVAAGYWPLEMEKILYYYYAFVNVRTRIVCSIVVYGRG